jgi:hypothetical protein
LQTIAEPKDIENIVCPYTWREVKQFGIPERQFYAIKNQLKEGKGLKLNAKTQKRLQDVMNIF